MEDYEKLMQYCLRILSKKRYTVFEMRKKMKFFVKKRKEMSEEKIDSVIERLCELNYLNDKNYIYDYVSSRLKNNPRGKLLMKRELKYKGAPKELIDTAFEKIEFDDSGSAYKLLEKRLKRFSSLPIHKQKAKAYQFLYSKGFDIETIYKTIDNCYNLTERGS